MSAGLSSFFKLKGGSVVCFPIPGSLGGSLHSWAHDPSSTFRESRAAFSFLFFCFLKILFIYSIDIETASKRGNTSGGSGNTSGGSGRGRSRLPVEKPDVGLDPIMPGPRPELKADA